MPDSATIERHAADLAWSLWTELGVPGVIRRHASLVVDPEPLLVATPELARADQRLQDEVLRWWRAHEDRLSVSRIAGLAAALPDAPCERFAEFSLRRGKGSDVVRSAARRGALVRERPPIRLPLERPSLLRLRMRALSGVGARADVLTSLLLGRSRWASAAELASAGYSKRTVARILTELADAGIATRRADGNTLRFRIVRPQSLSSLAADDGSTEPQWTRVFAVSTELLELARLGEKPDTVRRVAAHAARESIAAACAQLDWDPPPLTRGVPSAWKDVLGWGADTLGRIAAGPVRGT